MLACLNLLCVCVSILLEHYCGLHKGKNQQSGRDNYQCPSETNKFFRLPQQIFGLRSGLLSKLFLRVRNLNNFFDLLRKFVSLFGKFFGGFFRIFGKTNIKRNSGTITPLFGIHSVCSDGMNKQLKVFCRSGQNKVVDFLKAVWIWTINKFRGFLGRHRFINPQIPRQVNK